MKECRRCGLIKTLDEFYKHPKMLDGHLNICTTCKKGDAKLRYDVKIKDPEFHQAERIRGREKYHRLKSTWKKDLSRKPEIMARYFSKYPEKRLAHASCKVNCPVGHNNHHWSYNEEHHNDVIQLAIQDHYKAHRHLKYSQPHKMYRTLGGHLLDTREKHAAYITTILSAEEELIMK